MGLLSLGTPLPWKEGSKYAKHVRENGIKQFIILWNKLKDRGNDHMLWGDEMEYIVVHVDKETQKTTVALRAIEVLKELQAEEIMAIKENKCLATSWKPEYGRYMLEATPLEPYGATLDDMLGVESNMQLRRKYITNKLNHKEVALSIGNFPLLGAGQFTTPPSENNGEASHSLYIPDECINPHARFPTLTANIRTRRGSKVAINVPIFFDVNTPRPFLSHDPAPPSPFPDGTPGAKENHIYMDAMCFGMGCCCLQMTFQAGSVSQARDMYDSLIPFGPIMLALTAATPIFRGYLADVDVRWNVIAQSVDDRTEEERGLKPLKENQFRISKSRYDSVDSYISTRISHLQNNYNDVKTVYDETIYKELRDSDVDDLMAKHIAHLFIRDPLVVFLELVEQNNSSSSDHFENIQSTNWQTLRFKPPPAGSTIGWRVEFRPMEIQPSDYANAAFAIFIMLLARTICYFDLNLYVPMSKVDENMDRAHQRDAARSGRFHFRRNIIPTGKENIANGKYKDFSGPKDEYGEFSMDELINGCSKSFPGVIPLIELYLDSMDMQAKTKSSLLKYVKFVGNRASGNTWTTATYMRNFVQSHPEYKKDSIVTEKINFDLLNHFKLIGERQLRPVELFGRDWSEDSSLGYMRPGGMNGNCKGSLQEDKISLMSSKV